MPTSNSCDLARSELSTLGVRLGDDISDVELTRALSERHPDALPLAMTRFDPVVRATLWYAFRTPEDRQDARQDVYFYLFRDISLLREPTLVRAFVLGITKNIVRSERRRRRLRGMTRLEPDIASLDVIVVPDRAVAGHDLNRLRTLLRRLRTRERGAFVLRFVERMSVLEIAEALGVSSSTVQRSLKRAWSRVCWWAARDPHLVDYLRDDSSKSVVLQADAA